MVEDTYSAFIRKIEFGGLRAQSASYSADDDVFVAVAEECELRKKLEFTVKDITHDIEDEALSAKVCWQVGVKKSKKILFRVKAEYQIVFFNVGAETTEEHIENFCATTIKATTFPYFRQFFNQACTDASVRLPPLPMLKIMPKIGMPVISDNET